jgi:hypothetical protein
VSACRIEVLANRFQGVAERQRSIDGSYALILLLVLLDMVVGRGLGPVPLLR